MFIFFYLLSIVCFVICQDGGERIVSGEDAKPGQFPYHVSIQVMNNHICGGSIISERYILTAGHCLEKNKPYYTTIVTGTHNLKHVKPENTYEVEEFIIHEKYVSYRNYDIGLVKVSKNIQFNDKVEPIDLETKFVSKNKPVIVTGWGYTSYPGQISNILQFLKTKATDNEYCQKLISLKIQDSHLCTFQRRGLGVCFGDSGGPLVLKNKQVGIASAVVPCARGKPDVFTRISTYIDWINENMDENSEYSV